MNLIWSVYLNSKVNLRHIIKKQTKNLHISFGFLDVKYTKGIKTDGQTDRQTDRQWIIVEEIFS